MTQAPDTPFVARLFDRDRLQPIADGLAVALAVALPWSTSLTGILSVLWLVAVLPTLDLARLREIALSPAGGLPIVFTLLALAGTLWSQAPVGERFAGVVPFARLLAIPLLLCQFSRSPRGGLVLYGLLASCAGLLVVSYWSYWLTGSPWYPFAINQPGVPVRDYIVQSGFFTICIFALLGIAADLWAQQQRLAIGLLLLALAFLANIATVATSRTSVLVIAVLLALFALRRSSWKFRVAALGLGALLFGMAWLASDYFRSRITSVFSEIQIYRTQHQTTSSGQRLEMWSTSLQLIAQAPIIGHGTGSLAATFKSATRDNAIIPNADNPHHQTFAVAIQVGLVGVTVLYGLWFFHLLLFRGGGWAAWFGVVVVAQCVVSSLVNSYLFDFAPGWTYAIAVGVAGGIMLRRRGTTTTAAPA